MVIAQKRALKTYQWALQHKKGMTAGGDVHKLIDLGRCVICSKGKTIKEVLDSIKYKKTSVIGSPLSIQNIL